MLVISDNRKIINSYIYIIYVTLFIISGCAATTKPNISAIYKIPSIDNQRISSGRDTFKTKDEMALSTQKLFVELYKYNPSIAIEVGKLPEFQGLFGPIQELSLRRFIEMYKKASQTEKDNLNELLSIGKPEFRRYCSPLQAIIWLLGKNDYDPSLSPLRYDLKRLLWYSWDFFEKDRWNSFEVVTDRLNDPQLIDYYEQKQFIYERRVGIGKLLPDINSLFNYKTGDCIDITEFTIYCLRKAGYKAWSRNIRSPIGNWDHYITQFEMDGKHFIMDNGRPTGLGIILYEKYYWNQ